MQSKLFSGRDFLLCLMALHVLFCPAASVAQDADSGPAVIDDAALLDTAEPILVPNASPRKNPGRQRMHAVRLRVDGNLAGRVSMMSPTGILGPARATISFIQKGQLINSARSDERGYFQVVGLQPGVYSVVASGPDGFSAFSVQVLPFDPNAEDEQLLLDITLAPVEDIDLTAEEEVAEVMAAASSLYGGGGGGGGAGLAGLAALAGLAGLAGTSGPGPASPSAP